MYRGDLTMKNNILGILLPISTIVIINMFTFKNLITMNIGCSELDMKITLICGLTYIIPISLIINSIICVTKQINIKTPIIISILFTVFIMSYHVFQIIDIILCVTYYLLVYFVCYLIIRIIKKCRSN